ncbi:unnamed protein product [Closterium sp. Yama58-4]|nr:unnamed protein product [Closterium sp. Yama58-4]
MAEAQPSKPLDEPDDARKVDVQPVESTAEAGKDVSAISGRGWFFLDVNQQNQGPYPEDQVPGLLAYNYGEEGAAAAAAAAGGAGGAAAVPDAAAGLPGYDPEQMVFVEDEEVIPSLDAAIAAAVAERERAEASEEEEMGEGRGGDGERGGKKWGKGGEKEKGKGKGWKKGEKRGGGGKGEEGGGEEGGKHWGEMEGGGKGKEGGKEGAGKKEQGQEKEHVETRKELQKKVTNNEPNEWFELKVNTSVYVTGLPHDTNEDEVGEVFSKCGLIKEDLDTGKQRVKLYRDKATGELKGDGLITFLKPPSVDLALKILDGTPLRLGDKQPMSVTLAKFEQKGNVFVKKASDKNKKKKLKKLEAKVLGWGGSDNAKHTLPMTVALFHMLTRDEVVNDPSLPVELEAEVREECAKMGVVERVKVYPNHPDGVVTVRFKDKAAAFKCIEVMNGRWFGGRQISAIEDKGLVNWGLVRDEEEEARSQLLPSPYDPPWEGYDRLNIPFAPIDHSVEQTTVALTEQSTLPQSGSAITETTAPQAPAVTIRSSQLILTVRLEPFHLSWAVPSSIAPAAATQLITGTKTDEKCTPVVFAEDRESCPYRFSDRSFAFEHAMKRCPPSPADADAAAPAAADAADAGAGSVVPGVATAAAAAEGVAAGGDFYFGLGDKTGPFNLHSRRLAIGMRDALGFDPLQGDPLYKHWPLLLTRDARSRVCYGQLYDSLADGADVDLGCENSNYYGPYRVWKGRDGDLDMYMGVGPGVSEVIGTFSRLMTGGLRERGGEGGAEGEGGEGVGGGGEGVGKGRDKESVITVSASPPSSQSPPSPSPPPLPRAVGPALIPRWTLGLHLTAMPLADAPDAQARISRFISAARSTCMPVSAFHFGSGYTMIGKRRYVFHWNLAKFPDPQGLVGEMRGAGMRVVANVKPCMLVDHPRYGEVGAGNGFVFLSGDAAAGASAAATPPAISQFWDGLGAHLDFTNPGTIAWWQANMQRALLDVGIETAWNDNNEYEIWEEDACSHMFGCAEPLSLHRPIHALMMTRASFEQQVRAEPGRRPYSVTRAGGFGIQRYAQTWSGDNSTSWKSLRWNLRLGLCLSLSGLFNCGHDVGGFSGPPPEPELLVRWVQAGLLHPRFLMNSWKPDGTITCPWMYPDSIPAVRWSVRLRYRLIPYLYSLSFRASFFHEPIIRPTFYDFPEDDRCWRDGEELMVGPMLLAAPVVERGARQRKVYLPGGQPGRKSTTGSSETPAPCYGWFDFYSEEFFLPGQVVTVAAPLDRVPLFVRAGGIVAMTESTVDFSGLHDERSRFLRVFPPPMGSAAAAAAAGSAAGAAGYSAATHAAGTAAAAAGASGEGGGESWFVLYEDDGETLKGDRAEVHVCMQWDAQKVVVTVTIVHVQGGSGGESGVDNRGESSGRGESSRLGGYRVPWETLRVALPAADTRELVIRWGDGGGGSEEVNDKRQVVGVERGAFVWHSL